MVLVYTLRCPLTQQIRYVGSTMGTLITRLNQHLNGPQNVACKEWFASLKKEKLKPIIEAVDSVKPELRNERELYWINKLKSEGQPLTNQMSPGYVKSRIKKMTFMLRTPIGTDLKNALDKYAQKHNTDVSKVVRKELKKLLKLK